MPLTIVSPVCGSTVSSFPLTVSWTDSPPSTNYYVRIRSGPGLSGSFFYTSGLQPGGISSHEIIATNLPVGCSTQWLSVQYNDGTQWLVEECQVEFCVDEPVYVADCDTSLDPWTPAVAPSLAVDGCPAGEIASGASVDLKTNQKEVFPAQLVNEEQSDTFGLPQATWANDPNYTAPPCGETSYQTQWLQGELKASIGYAVYTGVNRYAKVCFWQKHPDFTRSNTDNATFGSVIYYKWGVGFFPCQSIPGSGFGGNSSTGSNGWSVRDQGYVAGYSSITDPALGNVALETYIYHSDMAGQFGETGATINGGGLPRSYNEVPISDWLYVEKLLCLNDINQNNGYVKTWNNGVLVEDIQGINFTNNPDLLSINRISFTNYHGGDIPAPSDGVSYIADPRIVWGDAALKEYTWTSSPPVTDAAPQCTDRIKATPADGEYTFTLTASDGQTVTCQFRVGAEAVCLDPIISAIVDGQSTITNPNDTPLTVTISSGSATFQNPIPANQTVIVTNIVGGDGVNAAGEAIKTFCITGNC